MYCKIAFAAGIMVLALHAFNERWEQVHSGLEVVDVVGATVLLNRCSDYGLQAMQGVYRKSYEVPALRSCKAVRMFDPGRKS